MMRIQSTDKQDVKIGTARHQISEITINFWLLQDVRASAKIFAVIFRSHVHCTVGTEHFLYMCSAVKCNTQNLCPNQNQRTAHDVTVLRRRACYGWLRFLFSKCLGQKNIFRHKPQKIYREL